MKNINLSVIIEKDKDGYFARCLDLQGCNSQGDTYEEALENIKDAISLYVADLKESNELLDRQFSTQVSLTTVPLYA
jgi:predicted RNase H-like HicB family nuclease